MVTDFDRDFPDRNLSNKCSEFIFAIGRRERGTGSGAVKKGRPLLLIPFIGTVELELKLSM